MVTEVRPALQMSLDDVLDSFRTEHTRSLYGALVHRVQQEAAERSAKPLVGRDVETLFFAHKNCRGKLIAHQLAQDELEA